MTVWPHMWRILLWTAILLLSGGSSAQTPPAGAAADIDVGNVERITPRLAIATGQRGGLAGAPLVDHDRLFVVTSFPHSVMAIELARADAPVLWRYTPEANGMAAGLATRDLTTNGAALSNGRLFLNTFDGHTIALDAETGNVLWDVAMADVGRGETLLAAPLLAGGRVFIGNSGSDFGVRGWMAALDAASGRVLWKHYNTGPDADVGIGSGFASPYLPRDPDPGVASWPPDAWQQGGGGLAGAPIHDAAAGLLAYATGHPAPWNAEQRPGANYFTAGIFARDATTGDARWFTPINPHDLYGFGAEGSLIAADLRWQGQDRAVLLHPDANGMVYVLDRRSGKILSAKPFIDVNATEGVDLGSGTLHRNPAKATQVNSTTRDICPAWPGATGGTAQAAFAPASGLLYIPASRLCMDMEARQASFMPGTPYMGANLRAKAAHGARQRGALIAWDVLAGKPSWTIEEILPIESGVLATAGGVVFYGTLDGWFKAVDAGSGKPLWQFRAASGIIGQPVSFRRADGHQYIAVLSGVGGAAGAVARQEIDIRDATAARGYANAIRDLKPSPGAGGILYVFSLP
ncbi:MAG TPA: PQQ-binding-like beta-propeller repeat protein [Acetobacteraceae bacterium]|jgi:PQQ-dependent dehydrogenase (methanol/ethanol family)|nr:PQQ-binding-like beta-propeller repeat protein [Acetobacteraceae bacterium]